VRKNPPAIFAGAVKKYYACIKLMINFEKVKRVHHETAKSIPGRTSH
jgi:hypothetical protein